MAKTITWEELLVSLEAAKTHPRDTAWDIYWYLKDHFQECGSQQARMLLATYTKIPLERPSLLHSCMLQLALKISEQYDDFNLLNFIRIWGYNQFLRPEDREAQTSADGRSFISLQDRTERVVADYLNRHRRQERFLPHLRQRLATLCCQESESRTPRRRICMVHANHPCQ